MITVKGINNEAGAGRFGNQLFKYCTAMAYSLDNGVEFVLPYWHFNDYLKNPRKILDQNSHIVFQDVHDDHNQLFITIPKDVNVNLCNFGYFQDIRYFHHQREKIIESLELKDEYKDRFISLLEQDIPNWKELKLSFIHVRRGDYKGLEYILPMQDKSYYDAAMQHIEYDKCIVFSDEIEWCKSTFDYPNLVYLNYSDRYFDMFIMTLCQSGIIANSTYSWFGAYLNKNNPKIIKPKWWFSAIVADNDHAHSKIKLNEWIEI